MIFQNPIGLDQPAVYEIRIQGRIENDLSDWFQGEATRRIETGGGGPSVTVLTRPGVGQAGADGMLAYIRDLGLTLLYVDCLSAHESKK
jgi:hypothetical protein